MTEEEKLDEVVMVMTELAKAMDDYLAKNGKPNETIGYGETLDALNFPIPEREDFYIGAGGYGVYATLTFISGGYWIHAEYPVGNRSAVLYWGGDGEKECLLSSEQCKYLTKYGFHAK